MKARDSLLTFVDAIRDASAPPCDGCANAARCAAESLACGPFLEYFRSSHGRYDADALREPTAEIFQRTVGRQR